MEHATIYLESEYHIGNISGLNPALPLQMPIPECPSHMLYCLLNRLTSDSIFTLTPILLKPSVCPENRVSRMRLCILVGNVNLK